LILDQRLWPERGIVVAEKARHVVDVLGIDDCANERRTAIPRLGAIVVLVFVVEKPGGVTLSLMDNNNYLAALLN
jgi:hypothetical protein